MGLETPLGSRLIRIVAAGQESIRNGICSPIRRTSN